MSRPALAVALCLMLTVFLQLAVCGENASTGDQDLGTRATDVSGEITSDTTWSGDMTITGNVVINEGVTLTISAGTKVTFHYDGSAGFSLNVYGTIVAAGTSTSKIFFTTDKIGKNPDNTGGWYGITFSAKSTDSSVFQYCNFSYGYYELNVLYTNVTVKDCDFYQPLSYAVQMMASDSVIESCRFVQKGEFGGTMITAGTDSSPTIKKCTFEPAGGNGILFYESGAPSLTDDEIVGGGIGLQIVGTCTPDVSRCLFTRQSWYGIMMSMEDSTAQISISETIVSSSVCSGIFINKQTNLKLDTCELSSNGNYGLLIDLDADTPHPVITGCNILGNSYGCISDDGTESYEVKGCFFGHLAPFTYISSATYFKGDVTSNIIIKDPLDSPIDLVTFEQAPVVLVTQKPGYYINTTFTVKGKAVDPDGSDTVSKVEIAIVPSGNLVTTWLSATGNGDWSYIIDASKFENLKIYDVYVRCQTFDGETSATQTFTFYIYHTPGSDDDTADDDDTNGRHPILAPSISNYWTWIELTAFIITLIFGIIGFFMLRSKKRRVKKAMKDIDTLAKAAPTNPQMAETELIRLHKQIKQQYEKGKLEDQHFLILERYLGQALTEVQRLLRQKGLPITPLTMQLDPVKPDAKPADKKGPAPPPPPKD